MTTGTNAPAGARHLDGCAGGLAPGGEMSQHATFLLLGLANGAVFAALGLALVVTHRSTKVLNFAVSAIALLSATIYSALATRRAAPPDPRAPPLDRHRRARASAPPPR